MTCLNPFVEFRINTVLYTTCCPPWVDDSAFLGDWGDTDHPARRWTPWQIWNCEQFQKLRQAVLDGDYSRFCSKCSRIIAGHIEPIREEWMKPVMERPPERILLEHDRTCQLQCKSCRCDSWGAVIGQEEWDAQMHRILAEFLPTAKVLSLMSAGEPLFSKSTLEIMETIAPSTHPQLKLWLMTNGLLMPTVWPKFSQLHGMLQSVFMSVDAATKATYEYVRWPGKWSALQRAMEYMSDLRKRHQFMWQLNFVVWDRTYQDMPAFVEMAIDTGVDVVHFARMLQLWHPDDTYADMDVCRESHPNHKDFLEVCKNPILKHPIVLAPTVQQFI